MLNAMRDGAKSGVLKFFLLGLLVLAAGGLVLTDVGGFFRGGVSATDVAKGKGFTIDARQFDRTVRRTLSQQGISPQQAYQFGLVDQILNREIQMRMLSREAESYGLRVGDETVLKQLAELTETLVANGGRKKDALQQVLRSQGISEDEFIETIRGEIRNNLFSSALTAGSTTISDATARDLYQFENETRDIQYFTLTNASVKGIEQPTDMQLEKYYETIKNQFLIPERRSVTIATLKPEALEDVVKIEDSDVRDVYDDNIKQYERPEQRTVRQAILSNADEAEKVVAQINKGKSVESAVKSVTGSKDGYLGENDFSKNGLLEEVAAPVFDGKKGDLIGPVETALGFHVIQLRNIKEAGVESFDSVKAAIKKELLAQRMESEMLDTANMVDDRLASGEELEPIVADVGLTTETFSNFSMGGTNTKDKDLFKSYENDRSEVLAVAFETDQGEASPVMELDDGRFITIRVNEIVERSYEPFTDVKKTVKSQWLDTQREAANNFRVTEAMEKIIAGASFKDVAKEYGARITTKKKLGRYDEVKAPLDAKALRALFKTDIGKSISERNAEGYVIATATSAKLPDASKAKADDIEKIKTQYQSAMGQDILTQYVNSLSGKYKVRINKRLLNQMYGTAPAAGN
ncbi:MAG: peptidyl-prolyl cis-trans isomerase [Alphaproteobacteria bacterium]|nr:peptidyl-prolyl cis-trans isomerase [Alphaproteobacteria bacterium]